MSLSWFSGRSLKVSPKARLVQDDEAEALRRKLESVNWKPENGFLKDEVPNRRRTESSGRTRAA